MFFCRPAKEINLETLVPTNRDATDGGSPKDADALQNLKKKKRGQSSWREPEPELFIYC